MTTKDVTLILHVNLECEKCYKKIQKIICKLQSKEDIRKVDYENTKNRVTISGNFDPVKLSKKLRCKACDAIKDIQIIVTPKEKEEKKPEQKKPEAEKKPEEKKKLPEEKKPEEKKKPPPEEKKPAPEEKKPAAEEKMKGEEKEKATPAAATTVNLQFTSICTICYPWPCSDPTHWGGLHHHPPPQMPAAQWPPCGGMAPPLPAPAHHQHPPSGGGGPQKWAPCGGPSFCGGCAWCHAGGGGGMNWWMPPPPPQPMCCPGPSMCRGCNGCKIVRESKFSYEEYPSSACAIM